MSLVKNGHDFLVLETLKSVYFKNEFTNWADFFNVDSDAIICG